VTRVRACTSIALVLACASLAGCVTGTSNLAGVEGKSVRSTPASLVPTEILGLTVQPEDTKDTMATFHRSYLDQVSLYSLRKGPQLEATLQVARFALAAKRVKNLQGTVVGQIGGALPRQIRYGTDTIYLTSATKQRVAIWFKRDYLFVLSTREEFDQPRTLLRQLLTIEPAK
jgi:hypothetical protein